MKTFFQVTAMISLMFMTMMMSVITFTTMFNDAPRHPWTNEGLLWNIKAQTFLLGLYFVCKIGIYVCNTYEFKVNKKRSYVN